VVALWYQVAVEEDEARTGPRRRRCPPPRALASPTSPTATPTADLVLKEKDRPVGDEGNGRRRRRHLGGAARRPSRARKKHQRWRRSELGSSPRCGARGRPAHGHGQGHGRRWEGVVERQGSRRGGVVGRRERETGDGSIGGRWLTVSIGVYRKEPEEERGPPNFFQSHEPIIKTMPTVDPMKRTGRITRSASR
jgi:hypothetical protein